MNYFRLLAGVGLAAGLLSAGFAQDWNDYGFQVSSTTFGNGAIMPLSTINNILSGSTNACSVDGSPGGNKSPELFWTGAPPETKTFVVNTYDVTASFTHWGMYNIPGDRTGLPEDAGVAGSKYGKQIVNDFGAAAEYDGPCPPATVTPYVHDYLFTVYALDTVLTLPGSANFPANAESLYKALIEAGARHHILATATLVGRYSSHPGN